jgi:hypothetical protein
MSNFLCRWPNGDLSLVSARDRNGAIIILDEIGDATEAELFENNNLFINFTLTDQGHLEFENFAEPFESDIMEKCYPLILKARMADEDETEDYTQAATAERLRLGQVQVQETDELAKNMFIARLVADNGLDLTAAIETYKQQLPLFDRTWHDLAETCNNDRTLQLQSGGKARNFEVSGKLEPYEEADLLPHLLFAATLAADMNASMVTIWDDVSKTIEQPIGSYWRWLAQETRRLSLPTDVRPN